MKICWDNLERAKFTKRGNFRINENTYIEMEACKVCGESYLTSKRDTGLFCSSSCAASGENNNMYDVRLRGSLNGGYKGGVVKTGLITYDACKDTLELYEEVRKQENTSFLEVRCTYCNRWYTPTRIAVRNRLDSINSLNKGEQRLYCSENCKQACPTYNRKMYPKGFKHTTSREVSTYLRQTVLERDNWTCQICGKTVKEAQLHVHHMDPVTQNPMFQNDADSCITLCKHCHKMIHKQRGCRYTDLRCKTETDYTKNFKEKIRLRSMNFRE